ncbi:MAG TPA: ribonuclease D, partial [Planctomycetaceae bacterium]|nr:ribonuclease D [Planctomycetaceae bacterium]
MNKEVEYRLVDDQEELEAARAAIEAADVIGMDTEFVAEDCYQPDLCLLQVATREEVFIVDPKAVADINCLWDLMVDGQRTVIVHAGREEILFAYRATGKPLANLFDVQVATGLLGGEYPASYGKLLQKFLGEMAPKGET